MIYRGSSMYGNLCSWGVRIKQPDLSSKFSLVNDFLCLHFQDPFLNDLSQFMFPSGGRIAMCHHSLLAFKLLLTYFFGVMLVDVSIFLSPSDRRWCCSASYKLDFNPIDQFDVYIYIYNIYIYILNNY